MSSNRDKNQHGISPPNIPLEEGRPIVYNITINVYQSETGDFTMIDNSKHETNTTSVQADKIEGTSIGKGNKTTNLNLDSLKTVLLIITVTISLLLIISIIVYVATSGKINIFPALQGLMDSLIKNSN